MRAKIKVLLTRHEDGNLETRDRFADAFEFETLESYFFSARPIPASVVRKIKNQNWDWVVFTSPRAVKFFHDFLLDEHLKLKVLMQVRVAVVGERTAQEVQKIWRRPADLVAYEESALGLAKSKVFSKSDNSRILLPQAVEAKSDLKKNLSRRHQILAFSMYQKKFIRQPKRVVDQIRLKSFDEIWFYSAESVRMCAQQFGGLAALRTFLKNKTVRVLGESTKSEVLKCKLSDQIFKIPQSQNSPHKILKTKKRDESHSDLSFFVCFNNDAFFGF